MAPIKKKELQKMAVFGLITFKKLNHELYVEKEKNK